MYRVTAEIKRRAAELGLTVKPSKNPDKKLDAYKDGVFQASFGATGYKDYHIYKREYGEEKANQIRRAYKARHSKDRVIKTRNGKYTPGYLADKILW